MQKVFNGVVSFLSNPEKLVGMGDKIIIIIITLVIMKLVSRFGNIFIDKYFDKRKKSRFGLNERKADTLSALLKSILKYTIYIIGIITVLDEIGFETKTLLVGAGVGGVAIGFGAQSLVKDVINGFFILFEDQFSVGDYVTIEDMSGVVETIGLRVTRLKDFSGDLHIIPNGQITKVTNHSRDNSRASVVVQVGYDVDIDKALEVLNRVAEDVKRSSQDIVDGPTVLGVSDIVDGGVSISIIAHTKPLKNGGVEMMLRRRIKEEFDKENIGIDIPRRVVITDNGNN